MHIASCRRFSFLTDLQNVKRWKSYFVRPSTFHKLQALGNLIQELDLDYFSHASVHHEGIVIVDPTKQETFLENLEDLNIDYRIHANDVKSQLLEDEHKMMKTNATSRIDSLIPYHRYLATAEIEWYMDEIARTYPHIAKLEIPSNSFRGRQIRMLKISTTNFEDRRKPIIFIDGGFHGREWLSIPPVTYAIHKLVEDITEPDLLDKFDWILMPMVNPDGYHHSYTMNAAWHKNRSNDNTPLSPVCIGVDIDRNFDFFWNTVGTSNEPCSFVYPGNRTFSEVEARMLRNVFHQHLNRLKMYISIHTFGSMILYPWGHDGSLSNQALGLHAVGVAMADAMNKYATGMFPLGYSVGNEALTRGFRASGMATDYAHKIGVPLTFKIELHGFYGGFFMDPAYIDPVVRETWEGIVAGARRAATI
ncbi:carboxypeptidase B-like [Zerene cesonia]|uniref:carboxypeptidase B-like n=1 Tax=Zerene cesonia TaxID=33412 RepID=UPI0018E4FF13|nr:carboxypeptidase B-like [Zerene cesonia]